MQWKLVWYLFAGERCPVLCLRQCTMYNVWRAVMSWVIACTMHNLLWVIIYRRYVLRAELWVTVIVTELDCVFAVWWLVCLFVWWQTWTATSSGRSSPTLMSCTRRPHGLCSSATSTRPSRGTSSEIPSTSSDTLWSVQVLVDGCVLRWLQWTLQRSMDSGTWLVFDLQSLFVCILSTNSLCCHKLRWLTIQLPHTVSYCMLGKKSKMRIDKYRVAEKRGP